MRFARLPELPGWARGTHELVSQTLSEFARHRSALFAAALAFHVLVSLAPLMIVAVAVAGVVFGRGTAHAELQQLLVDTLGPKAAAEIDGWVVGASHDGEVAGAAGLVLTLFAASKLGTQLRHILNHVRDVDADPLIPGIWAYVRRRLFAMLTAAAVGPLLLVALLSRTVLAAFDVQMLGPLSRWGGWVSAVLQLAASFAIVGSASAAAFRYVPDAHLAWKPAWRGGALTALLVSVGNLVLGQYFGQTGAAFAYEAASSGLVILLWLYFVAYTFLIGAELAQVLARRW